MYSFNEERPSGNPAAQQQRTLQIHPTLRCNLFCKHCYSSSGPNVRSRDLDRWTLIDVISDAYNLGYTAVSFSGGEPLLYEGLLDLLIHAKSLGMKTTVTTNGTIVNKEIVRKLKAYVDIIAISLDGPPEIHNATRGSKHAFDSLQIGVELIRNAQIRFGFIYTLTRKNWEQLLLMSEFAHKSGASLIQIHPLELEGRASYMMKSDSPDEDLLTRAYLLSLAIKSKFKNSMRVHYNAARRDYILENPELVYASDIEFDSDKIYLSDILNFVVVEADGSVVPIAYGFSRNYQLCNIKHNRLSEIWPSYLQNGSYGTFRNLCKRVFKEISVSTDLPFFNWYELLVRRSNELSEFAESGVIP